MRKFARSIAAVAALGLWGGVAHAGDVVYTDEGWYRVEGSAPTPTETELPPLQTEAAPRAAPAPAQPSLPPAAPMAMPGPSEQPPACLAERGQLMRRVLQLHGLDVSRLDAPDASLGALGAVGYGAPLPFSASLSLDPDVNLLAGNAPVPPSSANWDSEVSEDWDALVACQSGR